MCVCVILILEIKNNYLPEKSSKALLSTKRKGLRASETIAFLAAQIELHISFISILNPKPIKRSYKTRLDSLVVFVTNFNLTLLSRNLQLKKMNS